MLPAIRLAKVGFPLVGHERGADANLLEVLLHDLRDAFGVRHVGARYWHVPQLCLEVRGSCVLEHLLCFVGVVGVGLDALVEVIQHRRHVVGGDLPLTPEHALDDLLYVDGVVEGLADLGIVEGRLLVVHCQVANGVRRPELNREPFLLLYGGHIVGHETVGRVELVAGQRRDSLGIIRDGLDYDLLEVGSAVSLAGGEATTPPVVVGLHAYLGVSLPLDELVRSAADRLLPEVFDVLLYGCRRSYREGRHGKVRDERSKRLFEREPYGVLIESVDTLDDGVIVEAPETAAVVGEVRGPAPTTLMVRVLGVAPAVEVELHRIGVELRPVVELDALAQLEGVGTPTVFGLWYLRRQGRRQVEGARLEAQQRVEDLAGGPQRLAVGDVDGIQPHRVSPSAEDERTAPSTSASTDGPPATAPGNSDQRHPGETDST